MTTTILIDLDGVLSDFAAGVASLFGRPAPGPDHHGRDLNTALGITPGQMWTRVGEAGASFWLGLEATAFADELVKRCRRAGEVVIATSPSSDPGAAAGKVAWLQRRFGKRFRDFVITPRKELLAVPGRLLIDDTPKHVEAFRAAGGEAVLVPTWHNGALEPDADPLEPVRIALDALEVTR